MSCKCAHCDESINCHEIVWIYDDKEVIHRVCLEGWALSKYKSELRQISGSSAIRMFRGSVKPG